MALTKITNSLVAINAIQGTLIADNAITTVHIVNNAVTATQLADNAVTATKIQNGIIATDHLAADLITAAKIADDAISEEHLDVTVISSLSAVTANSSDYVMIGDASDSNNLKKVLVSDLQQTDEEIADIIGAMVSSNTESGITVAYEDGDNTLDFTVGTLNQNTTGTAATVTTAAQPNITSVGTLTTLGVDGAVTINDSGNDVDFRVESNDSANMLVVDGGNNKVLVSATNTASVTDAASALAARAFEVNGNAGEGSDTLSIFAMADGTGNYGMEVSNSGHNAQYDLLLNPVNGGSVGIGTATASSNYTTQLHVHGSGTGASIHITDNGTGAGNSAGLELITHSDLAYIWQREPADMLFGTTATERMRITAAGNVGIGTTSPLSTLEVAIGTAFTTAYNGAVDNITLSRDATEGQDNYAGSIGFSPIDNPNERDAVIAAVQSGSDGNQLGLAFFTHPSAIGGDAIVEKMRIEHDGKVGIGTASPGALLHLYNSSNAQITFQNSTTGTSVGSDGYDITVQGNDVYNILRDSGFQTWYTGNTRRMTLDSGGKLGIGTTTPQSVLQAATANATYSHFGGIATTNGHYTGISLGYTEAANATYRKAAIVQTQIGDGAARGHMQFLVDTTNDGNSVVVGDSKMMIHGTSGYVGIGNTDPQEELDITGDARISARLYMGTGGERRLGFSWTYWGYATSYRAIMIGSSSASYQTDTTGSVTPWFNYDPVVNSSGSFGGAGTEVGFRRATQFKTPNAANDGYYTQFTMTDGVSSGDFNDTSDVGLKKNIVNISNATATIKALRPIIFDWKDEGKGNGLGGFIAQEVETVLPNDVMGDNYEEGERGEPIGGKSINTVSVTAHLVKAVQELEARLAALEE